GARHSRARGRWQRQPIGEHQLFGPARTRWLHHFAWWSANTGADHRFHDDDYPIIGNRASIAWTQPRNMIASNCSPALHSRVVERGSGAIQQPRIEPTGRAGAGDEETFPWGEEQQRSG